MRFFMCVTSPSRKGKSAAKGYTDFTRLRLSSQLGMLFHIQSMSQVSSSSPAFSRAAVRIEALLPHASTCATKTVHQHSDSTPIFRVVETPCLTTLHDQACSWTAANKLYFKHAPSCFASCIKLLTSLRFCMNTSKGCNLRRASAYWREHLHKERLQVGPGENTGRGWNRMFCALNGG